MKLYESNFNGQLSILDIVKDLAKLHPQIVAPHLATLLRIANGAKHDDVITVKEIESSCASAIIPGIIFFSFLYFFFFSFVCYLFLFLLFFLLTPYRSTTLTSTRRKRERKWGRWTRRFWWKSRLPQWSFHEVSWFALSTNIP